MGGFVNLSPAAFRSLPDPALLYLSDQHARALAFLDLTVCTPGCLTALVAERECGKTMLVSSALARATRPTEVVQIDGTGLNEKALLSLTLNHLKPAAPGEGGMLPGLTTVRAALASRGELVVLVIENAHRVDFDVFEVLGAMARSDDATPRMSLVLTGEPGLEVLIHTLDRNILDDWTVLMAHIPPLNLRDVRGYMLHRVKADGSDDPQSVFAPDTFGLIHSLSEGIPGKINTLCDDAASLARESGDGQVRVEHVRSAATRLGWHGAEQLTELTVVPNVAVPSLSIGRDDETIRVHPLDEERTMIGRDADNGIAIDEVYVSRHHALIARDERGYWLFDMNSTNGTFVNGQRVVQRQCLYPGDQIRIGRHVMTFNGSRQRANVSVAELRDDRMHTNTVIDMDSESGMQAALEKLDQRIEHNPEITELVFERACLLTELGQPDAAVEQFESLTQGTSPIPEAHNNLAVLYAQRGEYTRARDELQRALELRDDYAQARENLGNILLQLALEQFDRAMSDPADAEACQIKRLTISRLLSP